jgi:hypothetical protein
MKGKKGDMEQTYSFIIYAFFVFVIFLVLLRFITNSASGVLVQQQVLAKEIALLIDASEPGTELTIEKGNFTISISKDKVEVSSASLMSIPSVHEFLSEKELETKQEQNKIIIKIFK